MRVNLPHNPRILWDKLRSSYWFLPFAMSLSALVLAYISLRIDFRNQGGILPEWATLFSGGADGARDLISVVASSIITVAGVTFSISIVILSLASQQYGPRLLRNFMRDRAIHITFGKFIATFVYSLVLLPAIHTGDDAGLKEFVPRFGTTISIVMAIVSVFVLIYFIHHIARSIQPSHIASITRDELLLAIHSLYPKPGSQEKDTREIEVKLPLKTEVFSSTSGYLQATDIKTLVLRAKELNACIKMVLKPGAFVAQGDPILYVYSSV